MKLPISAAIWIPLILPLAAGSMWAALRWRRRAHAKLMGGKWRRSNAVVTIGMEAREMLVAARQWLNARADDSRVRHEIAARARAIREQVTNRLLNLRGFYGLSRQQRALLEEMVRRLDALDDAIRSRVPPEKISEALSQTEQILDHRNPRSSWRILMLRYRFWPFTIQSRFAKAALPRGTEQNVSRT